MATPLMTLQSSLPQPSAGIHMRKLLLTLAMVYLSQSAFAEGFTKSVPIDAKLTSYQTISTVKAAKQQADGNTVVLEGHISDRAHTVNPEEFWFQDGIVLMQK